MTRLNARDPDQPTTEADRIAEQAVFRDLLHSLGWSRQEVDAEPVPSWPEIFARYQEHPASSMARGLADAQRGAGPPIWVPTGEALDAVTARAHAIFAGRSL